MPTWPWMPEAEPPATVRVTVDMDPELWAAVEKSSKEHGLSVEQFIQRALSTQKFLLDHMGEPVTLTTTPSTTTVATADTTDA
jgi:hypothetical protein